MKNTIAVVIPTYNRPKALKLCLKSIQEQTCLPHEIIVIDDGSNPSVTDKVFADIPASVTCRLLRNDQPKGANNARNRGIVSANSEFIAFLDDDDQFNPKKIELVTNAIIKNNDKDIFYHPAQIFMVNELASYRTNPYKFSQSDNIFRLLLVKNYIGGTPMVIARKQSLISVGLFDEKMPALQDYELWLRLAKENYQFHLLDAPLTTCYYTTKKISISKGMDSNSKATRLIEAKYSSCYLKLSKKEIKEHNISKKTVVIQKSLLNYNYLNAVRCQLKLFLFAPRLVNFLSIFIVLLGPKAVFKVKGMLSK